VDNDLGWSFLVFGAVVAVCGALAATFWAIHYLVTHPLVLVTIIGFGVTVYMLIRWTKHQLAMWREANLLKRDIRQSVERGEAARQDIRAIVDTTRAQMDEIAARWRNTP